MMLLAAGFDPTLLSLVLVSLVIICLIILLRFFKQPYIIAYILAGVLLGEHGFNIIEDEARVQHAGEFGLILLLFFIGMEISLPNLLKTWKVATIGTMIQILSSVSFVALIGPFFNLGINQIIILGLVISLSSSAVVIKLLQDNEELGSPIGQNVVSILLMQDILIVPMLIFTSYLGGENPSTATILGQIFGGLLIVGGIVWVAKKKEINMPFSEAIEKDHELQVFLAGIICFGFALITAFLGLSAALGAFVAGIFVHATRSTEWFHDSLHAFRVVFVAFFFISIGILIDLTFLVANWQLILLLLVVAYLTNHFINASILHYYGRNWQLSLYGGALLAQIGELGFILIATAFNTGIISTFSYQLGIIIISLSLLVSPFWITLTRRFVKKDKPLSNTSSLIKMTKE